jgi:hypothetical protein
MPVNDMPSGKCRGSETSGIQGTRTPVPPEQWGEVLTAAFRSAVAEAVQKAHGAGLAVPYSENGKSFESRPDGTVAEIDDHLTWSPTTWKTRP